MAPYRGVHALRIGVINSFGTVLSRASEPTLFWFFVAREVLLFVLFATLFLSLLLRFGAASAWWLFGGYAVIYATLILTTYLRRHRNPTRLLE